MTSPVTLSNVRTQFPSLVKHIQHSYSAKLGVGVIIGLEAGSFYILEYATSIAVCVPRLRIVILYQYMTATGIGKARPRQWKKIP